MAFNAGNLQAQLTLDFSRFTQGVRAATQSVKNLGNDFRNTFRDATGAVDGTSRALNNAGREMKDFERIVGGILLSQAFYQATGAIQNAAGSLLEFMNNMEKAQISLEYFLGSPERAQGFIMNMNDFAATTAFNTDQALKLSRRLMAAQFDPKQVRGVMEILNDASAASGGTPEQMDRIVLALTQIKTNGKVAGQELRQLAEAGIPIYQLLQEELGLTGEQIMRIGDLKIPGDLGVSAILSGLEKRYKGAADRIADTIPGMWETIRDDSTILASKIFEGPYQALGGFLEKWRDGMEEARAALNEGGLGKVLEEMFPKELHNSIRLIVGSIQTLAQNMILLGQALSPIFSLVSNLTTQALGVVLPILSGIINVLVNVVNVAVQAIPPIRWLGVAIVGLLVAQGAARALMFLWSVMRLGTIAAIVAQAVTLLRKSIQVLFLVLTRNPITGAIMVIAGALMYLALSSKTVSAWLDQVMARLASLGGFDIGEILQPEDLELGDWAGEFNDAVSGVGDALTIGDDLEDAGEEGKKAAKKIKDSFVAAFDEVYQVPEPKKDDGDDDKGDKGPGSPNMGLPNLGGLPGIDGPDIPREIEMPKLKFPPIDWPIIPPELLRPIPIKFDIFPPNWPPPNAFATAWEWTMDAIRAALFRFGDALSWLVNVELPQLLPNLNPQPYLQPVGDWIKDWVNDVGNSFNDVWNQVPQSWGAGWGALLGGALAGAGAVGQALENARARWGEIFDSVGSQLGTSWGNAWGSITAGTGIGVAAVAGALALAAQNWGITFDGVVSGLQMTWNTLWTNLTLGLGTGAAAVLAGLGTATVSWQTIFQGMTTQLSTMWSTLWAGLGAAVVTGGAAILSSLGISQSGWLTSFKSFISQMGTSWGNMWTNIHSTLGTMGSVILATLSALASSWRGVLTSTIASLMAGFSQFSSYLSTLMSVLGTTLSFIWANLWTILKAGAAEGWKWMKDMWNEHKGIILVIVGALVAGVILLFTGLPGSIIALIMGLLSRLGPILMRLGPMFMNAIRNIPAMFSGIFNRLPGSAQTVISNVVGAFRGLPGKIWEAIKSIPDKVAGVFANIKIPSFKTMSDGISATFSRLGSIAGFETGGIIGRDSIVRVGEKGKREAIVPLENGTAMAPFSNAVARDLYSMMGNQQPAPAMAGGGGGGEPQPILYVGTLIADDRSLKELERRMKVVRTKEKARGVQT